MADHMLTPSKISAWLECDHYMSLRRAADRGEIDATPSVGSYAQMLMDKGIVHEDEIIEDLRGQGIDICEVPERSDEESFAQWAERVRPLLSEGHEVLYQFPLVHDGVRGVADFLRRVDTPSELGEFSYEPADAKLTRTDAKVGHVLQLCFYAEALEALQGLAPSKVHLYLGSGETETIEFVSVAAYWRRRKGLLFDALDQDPGETSPEPCDHCSFCEFSERCTQQWRDDDALHFVAGITAKERERYKGAGVTTMAALAERDREVDDVESDRHVYLVTQAQLQRRAEPGVVPPHEVIELVDPVSPRQQLPEPHPLDIFLDFEGHPFWTTSEELFFLFGWLQFDRQYQEWVYEARWAHTKDEERANTEKLIKMLKRRRNNGEMHVYHYNHTERSALERLSSTYGLEASGLQQLVQLGVFVDLYDVVRQTVQIGAESYGLKSAELLAGYRRSHVIDDGAGAVIGYERWCRDRDDQSLLEIERYNEDDVRATLAVRDWLLEHPLKDQPPRHDLSSSTDPARDVDRLVARLFEERSDPESHLIAHLLGYWNREDRVTSADKFRLSELSEADQLEESDVIGGLRVVKDLGEGEKNKRRFRLSYPDQRLSVKFAESGQSVGFRIADKWESASISDPEPDARELTIAVNWDVEPPTSLLLNEFFKTETKLESLRSFAERWLDDDEHRSDPARRALLAREVPVVDLGEDSPRKFPSDAEDLARLVVRMDSSCLGIQGPPGTGKTYTGARLIRELVAAGKKVAICAYSHAAIDNLLQEVRKIVPEETKILRNRGDSIIEGVKHVKQDFFKKWSTGQYDILGGTSWAMSNQQLIDSASIDVLVIDEAGQMGLADALAAMACARSAILLGDPLQLAQVSKASHPDNSGVSALEHLIGQARTIPSERGVFLDVSRRMHSSICTFISEHLYEGRLLSHESCDRQSVGGTTGLRWVRVEHTGCSSSSEVEADGVHTLIRSLVGSEWVDADGKAQGLTADNIMVVAPYNAQVQLIKKKLDSDPETIGTKVGTVDRFQGQEAAVVIFSMTSSGPEDAPRGLDFLFSRERFNVSISRARALAYVMCTEALLDASARTLREMAQVSLLAAFVEEAEHRDLRPPPEGREDVKV